MSIENHGVILTKCLGYKFNLGIYASVLVYGAHIVFSVRFSHIKLQIVARLGIVYVANCDTLDDFFLRGGQIVKEHIGVVCVVDVHVQIRVGVSDCVFTN